MTSQQRRFSKHHRRPRAETVRPTLKTLPLAVALCFSAPLWADTINPGTVAGLPTGGTVAAGTVSSQLTSSQLTLTQSTQRAVLDWQSFNIDAGKAVQFIQPNASAAVLNRVAASANMSQIYGSMTANGTVVLMNPNGVYFHQGANINVGSLIVTTGRIDPSQFMVEGPITIDDAISGNITNEGSITAENAGLVALVAPSVVNKGAIIATGGRIALSGADRATVSLSGGLYEFAVPAGAQGTNATISNMAGARLEGKTILLSTGDAANLVSGVINLEGVQRASSAIVVDGNTVVLKSDLDAGVAGTISGSSNTIRVHDTASILDAVQIAKTGTAGAGATVELQAGTFNQQVKLNKANMTLRGVDNAKIVVPNSATTGVEVLANNVTVQGLEIAGPLTAPYSSLTTDQWGATPNSLGIFVNQNVTGFNITGNKIHDVRTGIRVFGTGNVGSITNNEIENTKGGILFQYTNGTGVTMTGNREREGGVGNEWGIGLNINTANANTGEAPAEWQASLLALANANHQMAVEDRKYATSNRTRVIVDDDSTATSGDDFNMGNGLGNARQPLKTIQSGIYAVVKGGTVQVKAGTYTLASTLNVNKSVTLDGAGEAQTLIDARGVTGNYGMYVTADDVTLSDFMLYGPSNDVGTAYGIKVSPGGSADVRLRNFTIRNVTSRGAGRAELDLNGVDGALIDNVTLNGARVSDGEETQGAGLQLTDSANVTVRNTRTLNNKWGGLALYQANRSYNQRVNNISIEASNSFNEANPVYMQDESALHDFGSLNIAGFSYAVRNAGSTASNQYTWLQRTKQKAYDYAVYVPTASASYIQGWSGSATTQDFEVGVGNLAGGGSQAMTIATAIAQANSSGATINVGAGTYAQQFTLNKANMTLKGETGAKLEVPDLGDVNAITINANNVTVEGMEIAGPINAPYYDYYAISRPNNVSRGIFVQSGARGFTLRNNNIHDVRTGILIDGNNGTGNTVSGNRIENTKSGISVQYTGGAGIEIANNREGDVGNEWGLNLNLNRYANDAAKEGAPTLTWQQHLLDLSAANQGWKVQDQGYRAANRTHVNVAKTPSGANNQGSVLTPINTLQGGVNAVVRGGRVEVKSDTYAESVTVDRLMNLNFNDVTLRSLSLTSAAAGSGIGGKLTATAAGGLVFDGGIKLLADTTLATQGRDIALRGAVQNNASTAYGLTLDTNAGNGNNRGDVTLHSGGADGNALGQLNVTARNVTLGNTLWVRNYAIDARGDVALSNNTLKATAAGVTSSLTAGGNVTGSTTSVGGIALNSDGNVAANVSAGGLATVSGRNVSGAISGASVAVTAQQTLDATVTAATSATLTSDGNVAANVSAGGAATVRGSNVSGTIRGASVVVTAQQTLDATVTAATSATLTSDGNVASNVSAGGAATVSGRNVSGAISGSSVTAAAQQVLDAAVTAGSSTTLTGREIRGSVNAATLNARADTTMNLALNVTDADLYAGTRADVSGRASRVVVESKNSYFNGSFPAVEGKGTGVPFINGVPQRSETVPIAAVIVRPPVIVLPPLPPMPPSLPPAPVTSYANVDLPSLPPTAAGAPGGMGGGTSPAATGGTGSSGGSGGSGNGAGTGTSSSGGGNGTTGNSSTSSGGSSEGGGGSSTGSTSSGSSGSSSGGATGGGGGSGSGRVAVAAGSGPRQVTVTRNAPGKAAGDSLDRGQGVEVDLSPGR